MPVTCIELSLCERVTESESESMRERVRERESDTDPVRKRKTVYTRECVQCELVTCDPSSHRFRQEELELIAFNFPPAVTLQFSPS